MGCAIERHWQRDEERGWKMLLCSPPFYKDGTLKEIDGKSEILCVHERRLLRKYGNFSRVAVGSSNSATRPSAIDNESALLDESRSISQVTRRICQLGPRN